MNRRQYLTSCCLAAFSGCLSGRREGSRSERVFETEPTEPKLFGTTEREYTLAFGEWFVHGYDATRIDALWLPTTVEEASGDEVTAKEGSQFVFVEATKKNLDDTAWRLWFSSGWAVIVEGIKADFGDYETVSGNSITDPQRYPESWIGPKAHREVPPNQKARLWGVTAISAGVSSPDLAVGYAASTNEDDHNVRWVPVSAGQDNERQGG